MLREKLLKILRGLEELVPPMDGAHHAIIACQYGDDEKGWSEQLAFVISAASPATLSRTLFIDEGDLDKPVEEILMEVMAVLATPPAEGRVR